jgi:hypothetical protein
MAESPSHKFGQIVGKLLEDIMQPVLHKFCDSRGLYLDIQGERKGVRNGKKVTWQDKFGNNHDLDFVIEKNGSQDSRGRPVAFIEAAWRRYTKHSKNKAQEIQGAVLPIAEGFFWDKPFLGAVLAGEFTQNSLDQLESVGFNLLYFSYESVVEAFEKSVGINARFDESTADEEFQNCIDEIEALSESDRIKLKEYLINEKKKLFDNFVEKLASVLDRVIDVLLVVPLYGEEQEFSSISDAVKYIGNFDEAGGGGEFRKYEIIVKYSNGDKIDASFNTKRKAEEFLKYLGS